MSIAFTGNTGSATATSGTIAPTVTINAGDTVLVAISFGAGATRSITSVVDSGGNTYTQQDAKFGSTAAQSFLFGLANVANSATSVTVTINGTYTRCEVAVATYTGVGSFGNINEAAASSGTLSVAVSTQDNNNFIVMGGGQGAGATIAFTASVGNLRVQKTSVDGQNAVVINDNTAATPSSVTNTVTSNKSLQWSVSAVELRVASGVVNGTATPSGVTSTSAENNGLGEPVALPSGVTSSSAENNPTASGAGIASPSGVSATSGENNALGEPVGLVGGVASTSAENNPLANPSGLPSGQSASSAENNPVGNPTGLPSGQAATSAENNPTASGAGIASPSGVSATSGENNVLGEPVGLASGVSVTSAENDPTASGTGIASPSGLSATSAENDPFGQPVGLPSGVTANSAINAPLGEPVAIPSSVSANAAANNPLGAPVCSPSGVSATSVENDPLGMVTAMPDGVSATATEHNPPGQDVAFPSGQSATAAQNDPLGVATALPSGVSVSASVHNPTAIGEDVAGVGAQIFGGVPRPFFSYSHERLAWSDTPLVPQIIPPTPPVITGYVALSRTGGSIFAVGTVTFSGTVQAKHQAKQRVSISGLYTPQAIIAESRTGRSVPVSIRAQGDVFDWDLLATALMMDAA